MQQFVDTGGHGHPSTTKVLDGKGSRESLRHGRTLHEMFFSEYLTGTGASTSNGDARHLVIVNVPDAGRRHMFILMKNALETPLNARN